MTTATTQLATTLQLFFVLLLVPTTLLRAAEVHPLTDPETSAIWHPDGLAAQYVFFRSPLFVLPQPRSTLSKALLYITAQQSPNIDGQGGTQSKLLCAYKLHVNGVPITAGPRLNVPSTMQTADTIDILSLLHDTTSNVLGISSYFNPSWNKMTDPSRPKLLSRLQVTDQRGAIVLNISTGPSWLGWNAASYYNPSGDNGAFGLPCLIRFA